MSDWINRPVSEIYMAFQEERLTPEALIDEAIARYEKWEPILKAYKTWDNESSLKQAEYASQTLKAGKATSLLTGIPLSVKDIYGVAGFPIYAGSPKKLPEIWSNDGVLIGSVRKKVPVITGKTHTVEFAFGGLGTNPHWGTPRNPWDANQHRVPGGSSSGAGVSLWQGSALIAFGTDTGGSVRVPASMTGTVGLKTTKNRWSTNLITRLSSSFDTPGILAKSVEDIAYGFASIDPETLDREASVVRPKEINNVKIGITKDYFWDKCTNDIATEVDKFISNLSSMGATTVPIEMKEVYPAVELWSEGSIVASEGYEFLQTNLPDWIQTLDPNVANRLEVAKKAKTIDYIKALEKLSTLSAIIWNKLDAVDVLAIPTVPISPPMLSDVTDPKDYSEKNILALSNTMPINTLGLCAISIPIGKDKFGMPVGLQLVTLPDREESLIAVALGIEKKYGTPIEQFGTPPLGGNL